MDKLPDPARSRFMAITLLRLIATLLIAGGIIIAFGQLDWVDSDYAMPIGIAMSAIGIVVLVVMIPRLTRRWRSKD